MRAAVEAHVHFAFGDAHVGWGIDEVAEDVAGLGIGALSARRLLASYRPSPASDAYLRMPVAASGPVERRPLLALLQRLPLG